jgi:hypothetical protein
LRRAAPAASLGVMDAWRREWGVVGCPRGSAIIYRNLLGQARLELGAPYISREGDHAVEALQ